MVNYNNTKIYYIPVGDDRYYGHTTQRLCERKKGHKRDSKRRPDSKLYKALRDAKISDDDIQLIWVENFPCNTKEEALARERFYVEQYATLNIEIPGRTKKEYREANKELMAQKQKQYYETNKVRESQRKAKFYEENKQAILEKYQMNKDLINARRKARYEANKDEINRRRREKKAEKQQSS